MEMKITRGVSFLEETKGDDFFKKGLGGMKQGGGASWEKYLGDGGCRG
jgi:hypothetical protein